MCSMKLQHIQSLLKMDMLTSLVPGSLTLLSNRKSICTLIVDFPIRYVGFLDDTFFLPQSWKRKEWKKWPIEIKKINIRNLEKPMFHMMWKKSIWFENEKMNVYYAFPSWTPTKKILSCGTTNNPPFFTKTRQISPFALKSNAKKKNTPRFQTSHRHAARRRRY